MRYAKVDAPLGFDSSVTVSEFWRPISQWIVPCSNAGRSRTVTGNA